VSTFLEIRIFEAQANAQCCNAQTDLTADVSSTSLMAGGKLESSDGEIAMTKSHKPVSVFRSVFRAAMKSRAREASRHVNQALSMLDDEALLRRGLSRDAISEQAMFHKMV
jgi:hypothetical protein